MLTKEQVLQADDIVTEAVPVPEWGGEVQIKALTGSQLDRFEQEMTKSRDKDGIIDNLRARWAAKCMVGEDGKTMFGIEEIVLLGKKSGRVLDRIFDACMRINGKDEKYIKELEKNSETTPPDASNTD